MRYSLREFYGFALPGRKHLVVSHAVMIRHLPFFLVAAEEQNFQRAANRLNVVHSALSRRMRDLERELGNVKLFTRTRRGVMLTACGEALLRDTRRVMAEIEEIKARTIAIKQGGAGVIRLGQTPGVVRHNFIEGLYTHIHEMLPHFDFKTSMMPNGQLMEQVRSGNIDAGVVCSDDVDEVLSSIDICEEPYHLALPVGHPLASKENIEFEDICCEPLIWYSKVIEPGMYQQLVEPYRTHGAIPVISLESPAMDTTLRLVARGLGISFVPSYQLAAMPSTIVLKSVRHFRLNMKFRLVWDRRSSSSVLPRIINAARSIIERGNFTITNLNPTLYRFASER